MGIRDLANEAIDLEKKQDALEKKKAWNLNATSAEREVNIMLGVPVKAVLAYSEYKDHTDPWGHRTTLQVGEPNEEIYVKLLWHKETGRDNWGGTRIKAEGWVLILATKEGSQRYYGVNCRFTDLAGLGKALTRAEASEKQAAIDKAEREAIRAAKANA